MKRQQLTIGLLIGCLLPLLPLAALQYDLSKEELADEKPEKRLALLIGNKDYDHISDLTNPINDINTIERTILKLGFEQGDIQKKTNCTLNQLDLAVKQFKRKVERAAKEGYSVVALVYYSGHGIGDGKDNYMVPVGYQVVDDEDVVAKAYGLSNRLEKKLKAATTRIILFDACRTSPSNLKSPGYTSVVPLKAASGTFYGFASEPDLPANDREGGDNSPFAKALAEYLPMPNQDIRVMFGVIRESVEVNTGEQQTPWMNEKIKGQFYFNPMGVKDSDGDGLTDNVDQCPYEKGAISNNGCPAPSDPFANQMVSIPSGSFQMGQPDPNIGCDGCSQDENPIHSVYISSFKMSKYEVTQRQWRDIMGSNPSYFKGCDNCPVEQVSWNDIQVFLRKLNAQTGKNYRLPTEAEWEYAARGGQFYKYAGSDNIGSVAWYYSNSGSKPHPVGQKPPNGYGLYNMTGNVWEWCGDWYGSDYYKNSPSNNPKSPSSGTYRVLRGGSWFSLPNLCRAANRGKRTPGYRDYDIGFRIVVP